MGDEDSELAILLTKYGMAFHSGNDEAPDYFEPKDLAAMSRQIRTYIGF